MVYINQPITSKKIPFNSSPNLKKSCQQLLFILLIFLIESTLAENEKNLSYGDTRVIYLKIKDLRDQERATLLRLKKLKDLIVLVWNHRRIGLDLKDVLFENSVPADKGLALSEKEWADLYKMSRSYPQLKRGLDAHINERDQIQQILVEFILGFSHEQGAGSNLKPNETLLRRLGSLGLIYSEDIATMLREELDILNIKTSQMLIRIGTIESHKYGDYLPILLGGIRRLIVSETRRFVQRSIVAVGQDLKNALELVNKGFHPDFEITRARQILSEALALIEGEEPDLLELNLKFPVSTDHWLYLNSCQVILKNN